jgi:hypothetical protein
MLKKFEELLGKTLTEVKDLGSELVFALENGESYALFHSQDCCEQVIIEDIVGDLDDLVGTPILMAEEITNADMPVDAHLDDIYRGESETWTFYKLATINGFVTIRWYGSSNGYYSESVDWKMVNHS